MESTPAVELMGIVTPQKVQMKCFTAVVVVALTTGRSRGGEIKVGLFNSDLKIYSSIYTA